MRATGMSSTSRATARITAAAMCAPRSDEAVGNEVTTINGLVILTDTPIPYNPEHTNPPGGLENYYRENVIGGTNAFVMAAENFESFGSRSWPS